MSLQRTVQNLGLTCLSLLVFAGCAPKPLIQKSFLLDDNQTLENTITSPAYWPHNEWWRYYQDQQLISLITLAFEASPTFKTATNRIELAKLQSHIEKTTTRPSLQTGGSLGYAKTADDIGWRTSFVNDLSYDLDLWNGRASSYQKSVQMVGLQEAQREHVRLMLTKAIIKTYLSMACSYQIQTLLTQRHHHLDATMAILKKRYHAGLLPHSHLDEWELQRTQLEQTQEQVTSIIAQQKLDLALLCGQKPDFAKTLTPPTARLATLPDLPEEIPSTLLRQRPDVTVDLWNIEVSKSAIQEAHASFYPTINLHAFVGFDVLGLSNLFDTHAMIHSTQSVLTLPLFDRQKLHDRYQSTSIELDNAIERYNATLLSALKETSIALTILQTLRTQIAQQTHSLKTKTTLCQSMASSYKAGLLSYEKILGCEEEAFVTQGSLLQLDYALQDHYVDLMIALGGGLTPVRP